jgi:hypothetical protein
MKSPSERSISMKPSSTHARRLLKGADLLVADAKRPDGIQFDMSTYGRTTSPEAPHSCGTTACAMGLFGLSGAFKRAGFEVTLIERNGNYTLRPRGGSFAECGMALFGLNYDTYASIFASDDESGHWTGAEGELKMAHRLRHFERTGEVLASEDCLADENAE